MGEKDYKEGFAAGWFAASRAIIEALTEKPSAAPPLEMAGNHPAEVRRRGRPPKSASMTQPSVQQTVKRPRGRPRKTA